jgi:hypothetical protein
MQEQSKGTDGGVAQEVNRDQIKYDSPELQSGKYYVIPMGGFIAHRRKDRLEEQ